MTRQVLVCGYYGFANTGDEAILHVLLEDLAKTRPDASVTVLSGRPASTSIDHGVEAIHWQDTAALVSAAMEADLMVLGGGGLFQDHHGFDEAAMLTPDHGTIGYYAGFALLARLTETPLAIYGVGVGPLKTDAGKRWTRIAFTHASSASVRDEGSRALLGSIGVDVNRVEVTADPVWGMSAGNGEVASSIFELEHIPGAGRTITVSVRPWGEYRWAQALAEGLDRLVSQGDTRVLFLPFQDSPYSHENDPHACVEVLRRMEHTERAAIVRGGYSVEERAAIIGSSDMLVGMRLHSVIFGLGAGVPTVALAYDPKVSATMTDLGLGELCSDLDALSADWLAGAAKTAGEIDQIPGVAAMRERASANSQVLTDLSPPPPLDEETIDSMQRVLVSLAARTGEAVGENRTLRSDNELMQRQREHDLIFQENLERQRRELADTRAIRVMNVYWKAKERLGSAANRVPRPLEPVLRRLAGGPSAAPPPMVFDPEALAHAETQVQEVLDRHRDVAGIVIYPPTIGWAVSLFQRPQQMALAFARRGYLVFYGVYVQEGIGDRIEPRAERVYLYPDDWATLDVVGRIPNPIIPTYVYNFAWTKRFTDPRVIFEHIDELEVFTTTHPLRDLREWYEEAIEGAEVVVASARDLLAAMQTRRPDAFLCPNGVEYRHFADYLEGDPPEDIADIAGGDRPIVGYYGALAEWVDYPLIRKTAIELSDFEFVFIGPDYDGSIKAHTEVFGLPNVRWLGVKEYSELPAYLHYFDVATIPFVVNEVTHSVSPIKLFEYMAGGRPVVTPNLRECAFYEAVQVATDADDYVAKVRHAALELRHDPDHEALLRRTARANTWEMRVGTLIDALARSGRL